MFNRNQTTLIQKKYTWFPVFSILIIVMLIGFCVNLTSADSAQASTTGSSKEIKDKYDEIRAIYKGLASQEKPEELEKLVQKSSDFVDAFPEYKRVDQVYYYLGYALVMLERVEEGIKVFETFLKEYPEARYIPPSLYELGLAYDKLGKYDKADETYKKLIDHPKHGEGSYAKQAKNILEQDRTSRKGRLPRSPAASSNPSEWIGEPAPDFQVKDLKGEELSLEKYRGQVVLLDFWATWCGPCLAELPNVKRTYEKFKDQKFQIIGISLDTSKQSLETFVEREGLAWDHYWDQNQKVMAQYGVRGIPSTFLLDGEGVIRKTNLRGHVLDTAVAELVGENLTKLSGPSTKTSESNSQSKSIPATKLIKPSPASQKNESLQSLKAKMNEWVGKPAPDFQVTDLKGEKLSLKDYRGQVVLLDFWATWCGPCLAEMPKVKKTYEKYKDQKFQIIGISRDRSKTPLEAYVEKEELAWINYWDENGKLTDLYKVIGFPTTFLLDGAGVIRKASLGGFDVESAVAELVKENLAKQDDSTIIPSTGSPEPEKLFIQIFNPKPGITNGIMVLNDKVVGFDEMSTLFTNASKESDKVLIIKAELVVSQEQIAKVVEAAKQANFDGISFAVATKKMEITDAAVAAKTKEIIDAAVAAHGGLEKLAAVKNIVIESHSFEHFPDGNVQDEGRSKTYYYPNKFRSDWDTSDGIDSLIFDGNSLFQLSNGNANHIPPDRVKSTINFFKDSLFREPIWLLTNLSQNEIPVQYMGTAEVKGVPTSVLLVPQPSGIKLKIYISDETHYVVQFNYSLEIGGGKENVETLFENYRDVDGIKIAYHRTSKNGEYRQTLITDVKLNAEIDEALFSPKESDE